MECPLGHRFFLTGPDRIMDGPMQSSQVRRAVQGLLTRDIPIFLPCRCHHQSDLSSSNHQHPTSTSTTNEWENQPDKAKNADDQTMWAQLTRIYLALPSSPLQVCIQPCVRPGPAQSTPIFHLGPTLDQFGDQKLAACLESNEYYSLGFDEDTYSINAHDRPKTKTPSATNCQKPGFVALDNGFLWVVRLPLVYYDGTKHYAKPKSCQAISEWKLLRGCIKIVL